ncbi:MAG: helix-turn-helix transcriptional regulator [Clostridia bacterium]|nr:helix-turn-helix transcriptional regulator [Clostridia bacterium]
MKLEIGQTIRSLRTQNKVTQEELALHLGVTAQAISRWENESGYPDIELIPTIAAYFSVTTDTLLGIDKTERKKRFDEIYRDIKLRKRDIEAKEHIPVLRGYAAEFPSDEYIRMSLADMLFHNQMETDPPDTNILREIEQLLKTVAEKSENIDRRNDALRRLAELYAFGFKDEHLMNETLWKMPSLNHGREIAAANIFSTMNKKSNIGQYNLLRIADTFIRLTTESIVFVMPNDASRWEEKVKMLHQAADIYRFVCGDEMLELHCAVADILRYIATYTVAMKKYDETLENLQEMLYHYQKAASMRDGDRCTSPLTDQITWDPSEMPLEDVHESIYWARKKMNQSRYDPIRNDPRFQAIVRGLDELIK